MGCYALLIFSGCCRKDRSKVRFVKGLCLPENETTTSFMLAATAVCNQRLNSWIVSSNSPAALYGSNWHHLPLMSHFGGLTSANTMWIGKTLTARIISDLCKALKGTIISLNVIIQFQLIPFFPTCQPNRAPISPSRRIVLEKEHAHGIVFLPPTMHLVRSSGPTKFNKCFRAQLVPVEEAH